MELRVTKVARVSARVLEILGELSGVSWDRIRGTFGEGPHQRIGAVGRGAAAFAQARRVGRIPFGLRAVEVPG